MAKRECAYYSSRVSREYLESDHGDSPGSARRSETLAHDEHSVPFAIEDATGSVAVDAEGAEVDAWQVVDRFEPHNEGNAIYFGGVPVQIGSGEHTLGIRYAESILAVDAPIYVMGAVKEGGDIGLPPAGETDKKLVVSHRSEEALARSFVKKARILGLVAVGVLVFGAIFAAIGVAAALGYIEFEPTNSDDPQALLTASLYALNVL